MQAEIVFTGLCSILNPDGKNSLMGEPAVILVDTEDMGHAHHDHISFIAFDPTEIDLTSASGVTPTKVPKGKPFVYVPIKGVELQIAANPFAMPTVQQSFNDFVAHRDDYWPDAAGKFDPEYVPPEGHRPVKKKVKAWMRFGKGEISASRVADIPWRFKHGRTGTITAEKKFAEEVVYGDFPHTPDSVVIRLKDLEDEKVEKDTLTFSLKASSSLPTLTLFIGNNLEKDIANCVFREQTKYFNEPDADHFKFLNRIAGLREDGPLPTAINPRFAWVRWLKGKVGGGGSGGGACGPGSGNGRTTGSGTT